MPFPVFAIRQAVEKQKCPEGVAGVFRAQRSFKQLVEYGVIELGQVGMIDALQSTLA